MTVYLAALIFGAILLGASAWRGGGHGDGEADAHLDHDVDAHVDHDVDAHVDHAVDAHVDHDHDHGGDSLDGPLTLVLSARFWTFGLAFFGLTGLTLHGLDLAPAAVVPFVASGVGLACGFAAARLLRALGRNTTGEVLDAGSHVGRDGRLLLPLSRGGRSKVRLRTPTGEVDFLAELDASQRTPLKAGARVWVVAMRGATALVAAPPPDLDRLSQLAEAQAPTSRENHH